MKPFQISDIYDSKEKKFVFFKEPFREEPCHEEYCKVAKKLCGFIEDEITLQQYCYMSHPVIFVKENIQALLSSIQSGKIMNWKNILGNTYRFSEYYLYGLYTDHKLNLANHFEISKHLFPMIDIGKIQSKQQLLNSIKEIMTSDTSLGVWLQKSKRNSTDTRYFEFDQVLEVVKAYWDNNTIIK